jgi:hypothetical protein
MKYFFLILLVFSFGGCNKKNEKVNFEINQMKNETNDIVQLTDIENKTEAKIQLTNDMLFTQFNNIQDKVDTEEISYVTRLGSRIFIFENLAKDIYKIPELYNNNYSITESKKSGNMEPTGILLDDKTTLIEVANKDFEIYYWEKDNVTQIRRIIIYNNTEISSLSGYIGLSVENVINDFGEPVFQDGANNGDYGTIYYGIGDGSGRDFGKCEVFFCHKKYIINEISYGFSKLLIKGWD